jgi:hypothetical protein
MGGDKSRPGAEYLTKGGLGKIWRGVKGRKSLADPQIGMRGLRAMKKYVADADGFIILLRGVVPTIIHTSYATR